MKDNMAVYKIWAPDDALWTQWAKPVLFMNTSMSYYRIFEIPKINWISAANKNTMIIVDLPGISGVYESLALARLGYRPVPLYNGVDGPSGSFEIINVRGIVAEISAGANMLAQLSIRPDAPPAFMLDSNRMKGRGKTPRTYDNRWCVFPQDMPSASFLLKNSIDRIIVRSEFIQNDLSHILCRYQEQGIKIYLCDYWRFREIIVSKPSKFKSLFYRLKVTAGLTRNATGGFGGFIPDPMYSNMGGGYYGIG